MTTASSRVISALRLWTQAASAMAVLVGCLVLLGWTFDIAALKSVLPMWVTMKANTATAFVLAGVALWLVRPERADQRRRRTGHLCAFTIAVLGLLTLGEYLFGWDLGIDQLLFHDTARALGTSHPGRMPPTTALSLPVLGCALLLLDVSTRRGRHLAQVLVLSTAVLGLLAVVGYTYGATAWYSIGPFTQMALHTAVTFVVLATGILVARPGRGIMALLTGSGVGSVMMRRLLPWIIGIPLLLGWLRYQGQHAGLYGTAFGVSFMVMSSIVVFAALVWWTAQSLERTDRVRTRTEEALREQADLLDLAHDAVIVRDPDSVVVSWNRGAEALYGWSAAEARGRVTHDILHTRFPEGQNADTLLVQLRHAGMWEGELVHVTRAGDELVVESRQSLRGNERGRLLEINRDVTARKRLEGQLASLLAREHAARVAAERTAARIARLQAVTAALAGALTPEDVADAIIAQGVSALGADFATVAVVAEGGAALRLLRVTGLDAAEEARLREIPLDTPGHLPDAVRTGTIVVCASAAEAAARYPAVAAERAARGLEAGVALPLRAGARIIGGLALLFTAERRFSAEDLAFLQALADLCAQALDRARLYEAEQRARAQAEAAVAQLQTVQAVTDTALAHRTRDDLLPQVLERLMSVLAVDNTAILLPSEDRESLVLHLARGPEEQVTGQVRIPLGQGLAGQVAATRRPLVVDELAQGEGEGANPVLRTHIRSLLGVPLLVEDRLLGVLHVGSARPRRFTADDVRFLQLVADRVALALDQDRADAALRQAHDQALTALRERDAFLSVAAHELKTPLTSLRGFAQILLGVPGQSAPRDPARTRRALCQIEGQTRKLSLLVDQLLDVARLETGRLALDRRQTDLAALVAEVAAAARVQTDQHTVSVEAPPSAPAWVDPLRLEQVLTNLVGNAIKYSPQGGPIALTLAVDPCGATAWLAVRDWGLGVPEERRAHIFDRFYQAHADHHRSGLGLGLYISHEIVALHGGWLDAEFPADGGSIFSVTLPTGRGAGGGDDG